jgi:hypothetical protein
MDLMAGDRLRVLLLMDRDDMGSAIVATLRTLGCSVTALPRHRLRRGQVFGVDDCDVVFAYGPHNGSIVEAARTIDFRSEVRPQFVWWLLENLPPSTASPSLVRAAASIRLTMDESLRRLYRQPIAASTDRLRHLLERGHRVRILGEARYLHDRGMLDGFYVDSFVAWTLLTRDGIPAVHLPYGGHESFGRDLGQHRDLDVIFLGQPGSPRRLRLLKRTRVALERHRLQLHIFDGRSGYIDGEARVQLLNRAKIIVNLLKAPEDSVGLRFLIATANGTLTVSEPTRALTLLTAGKHYVEAPTDDLASAIARFAKDEPSRRAIVGNATALLAGAGHLREKVGTIVTDCVQRTNGRH